MNTEIELFKGNFELLIQAGNYACEAAGKENTKKQIMIHDVPRGQ